MTPSGTEVGINGIEIFRFSEDGKMEESWDSYDHLNLMRQSIEQELRMARGIQQAPLLPGQGGKGRRLRLPRAF